MCNNMHFFLSLLNCSYHMVIIVSGVFRDLTSAGQVYIFKSVEILA